MTKEQKELLLKDLTARLPYGVKVEFTIDENIERKGNIIFIIDGEHSYVCNKKTIITYDNIKYAYNGFFDDVKPYLFPLSSMTEEQKQELNSLLPVGVSLQINSNNFTYFEINTDLVCCFHIEFWDKFFDWLNKNHFDHRGLIEKGLALDATNKNIY